MCTRDVYCIHTGGSAHERTYNYNTVHNHIRLCARVGSANNNQNIKKKKDDNNNNNNSFSFIMQPNNSNNNNKPNHRRPIESTAL